MPSVRLLPSAIRRAMGAGSSNVVCPSVHAWPAAHEVLGAIVAVTIIAVLLYGALRVLERLVVPWSAEARGNCI